MSECTGDPTLPHDHHERIEFNGGTCPLCLERRRGYNLRRFVYTNLDTVTELLGEGGNRDVEDILDAIMEEVRD